MNKADKAWLTEHWGKEFVAAALVGDTIYRLRTVPGTILVCGLVVGYVAWLEARSRMATLIKRARSIVHGT